MQAVGRLGNYISRSVYTVSGPFHPFGGAVDIIIVEQPDGSYKSSPWYVRFGKFQGVLKSKEKVVSISVNGVEANFHMHLDNKGEAFFMKEVDVDESTSPQSKCGEDSDEQLRNRLHLKSKSCNYDSNSNWSDTIGNERRALSRVNSKRSQIFGFVFGKRSSTKDGVQVKEDASGVVRTGSIELAEIAADLMDLRWSTNLDSPKQDNASRLSASDTSKGEYCPVEVKSNVEENGVEMKCVTSEYIVESATSVESVREEDTTLSNSDFHVSSVSIISEVAKSDSQIQDSVAEEENARDNIQSFHSSEVSESSVSEQKNNSFSNGGCEGVCVHTEAVQNMNGGCEEVCVHTETVQNMSQSICIVQSERDSGETMYGPSESIVTECYSQVVCLHKSNDDSQSTAATSGSSCSPNDEEKELGEKTEHESSAGPNGNFGQPCSQASTVAEEELLLFGDMDGLDAKNSELSRSDHDRKEADPLCSSRAADGVTESSDDINDYRNDGDPQRRILRPVSSVDCINETGNVQSKGVTRIARSLPAMGPLSNDLEASHSGVNACGDKNHQLAGAQITAEDDNILKASKEEPADPSIGSRLSWPFSFRRSIDTEVSDGEMNGSEDPDRVEILNNSSNLTDPTKVNVNKKIVTTLTPTSEQLASLNLEQGKNTVVFTFHTAMLGKQQVDARIFLWKWDTRIVISDVDGTITRSDLLGQVMPLVGMDWSQTGVAHLFSAIKENGYQLLFLSARSISQSFITRQFLLNIKQDGKALPDGPVVISPDGLFPSLFREVVRRAPHEFKIACLEDIKALFPAGSNPFYAGFGNRDTDEFSYLKVGIPKGKIFIINPKGEIAVNRRVDTKTYLALHDLVHGMFPSVSTCEQEDYNSWNYWKLPPPPME